MRIFSQTRWQKRMIEQGRCRQCGKVNDTNIQICKVCQFKQAMRREKMREQKALARQMAE